jgi:hypothetical protein
LALLNLQQPQQRNLLNLNGNSTCLTAAASNGFQQQQPQSAMTLPPSVNSSASNINSGINQQTETESKSLPPEEQPLDLSSSHSFFGPAEQQQQQRKNSEIRRSVSSVSYYKKSNADVSEHFIRTFSGKWPRTSLRAHIQASGSRAKSAVGETVVEGDDAESRYSPMDETSREASGGESSNHSNKAASKQPSRPSSRLQHKFQIFKFFNSNKGGEVKEG